jgi:hypothetical protein
MSGNDERIIKKEEPKHRLPYYLPLEPRTGFPEIPVPPELINAKLRLLHHKRMATSPNLISVIDHLLELVDQYLDMFRREPIILGDIFRGD